MDRGQAHTLEGIAAGILLLASLLFAFQSTVITPLSASTSNQHIENQHEALSQGLLTVGAEDGTLKDALLYWGQEPNSVRNRFHCSSPDSEYYTGNVDPTLCNGPEAAFGNHIPPNKFGEHLEETFGSGIATNVRLRYLESNDQKSQLLLFQGQPSDNAVRATTTVVLYDNDRLLDSTGDEGSKLENAEAIFYASDNWPSQRIYNVVTVEVIIWRI